MKSVSVVIPNYNGQYLLAENLPYLYTALAFCDIKHEVIVVDDASNDCSIAYLQEHFPAVSIIKNEVNMGFSPTVNKGICNSSMDLVFILNSDVQLTLDYFIYLFEYFECPDTFGVAGRTIGLKDETIQESAKYPLQLASGKIQPYNYYVAHSSKKYKVPTLYLSGSNALIDRHKLLQLKGYLEIYAPFYVEDADLGIRAWLSGWKCYYEHNAICRHPASVTIKKYHRKKQIWMITNRNKLLLHYLYLRGYSSIRWNLKIVATLLFHGLICNWKYHRSFIQYMKRRKEVKHNQHSFKHYSIEKIMRDMRSEIDSYDTVKLR